MARFRTRRFASPAILKTIAHDDLIRFLVATAGAFLRLHGIDLTAAPDDFDHDELARVLGTPERDFPPDLADALHQIHEVSDPDGFDELVATVHERGLAVILDDKTSPADLAVRLWLADRSAFERLIAERTVSRSKRFEGYRGRSPVAPDLAPARLSALQDSLAAWFEQHGRERYARVSALPHGDGRWFLVRHGMPLDRRGVIRDGNPTSALERPEVFDVVTWDADRNELAIHSSTKRERDLYRRAFGEHLFGDPDHFPKPAQYTLAPLRTEGEDCLRCDDIDGIEAVTLRELKMAYKGETGETVTRRAAVDLFPALRRTEFNLTKAPIVEAAFLVTLTNAPRPRTVRVRPPNVVVFQREDEDVITRWLIARRFIVAGDEGAREEAA